jgi:hypothetical protein
MMQKHIASNRGGPISGLQDFKPNRQHVRSPGPRIGPSPSYGELFEAVGVLIYTTLALTYCISILCVSTMVWEASLSSAYF